MKKYRTFEEFTEAVISDPNLQSELKADPERVLSVTKVNDKWVYRMAMWILGLVIVFCIIGAIYLFDSDKNTAPAFLVGMGSTALGAVAGLISQNT